MERCKAQKHAHLERTPRSTFGNTQISSSFVIGKRKWEKENNSWKREKIAIIIQSLLLIYQLVEFGYLRTKQSA